MTELRTGELAKRVGVQVRVLYFERCPNHPPTVQRIRSVATRLGVAIDLQEIKVTSEDDPGPMSRETAGNMKITGIILITLSIVLFGATPVGFLVTFQSQLTSQNPTPAGLSEGIINSLWFSVAGIIALLSGLAILIANGHRSKPPHDRSGDEL